MERVPSVSEARYETRHQVFAHPNGLITSKPVTSPPGASSEYNLVTPPLKARRDDHGIPESDPAFEVQHPRPIQRRRRRHKERKEFDQSGKPRPGIRLREAVRGELP